MNATVIEWCDHTWNPIVGCTEGCGFCYARRQAKRRKPGVRIGAEGIDVPYGCQECYDFRPHLHPERLDQPAKVKSPRIVFCGSMGDLFDPHVEPEWRQRVWMAMNAAWWHHYVVLTKRPDRIDDGEIREHCQTIVDAGCDGHLWLGVSVTCEHDWWRVERLLEVREHCPHSLVVSFEPLLGSITREIPPQIGWAIIGAQTGPGAEVPEDRWIRDLAVNARDRGIRVFEKDNLEPYHSRRLWQFWPEAMVEETTGVVRRDGARAGVPVPRNGNDHGAGGVAE